MNTQAKTPATEEPKPHLSEDSVPQDDGTDNSWQMEPLTGSNEDDKPKKPA